ncbi:MAG: PAS domain S-box protein [Thermodesulfobacteriota bacterium]
MSKKPTYQELEKRVEQLADENAALQKQNAQLDQDRQTLQKRNQQYQQLAENLNDILYILDQNATITYVSPNIERISGYRPEEIIGRSYANFLHPDDRENLGEQFRKIIAGEAVATERLYETRDGRAIWFMTNARPIKENDRIIGIQGLLVDITQRKQVEQALQQSEEKYRTILETIEDGYFEADLAGNLTFFNDALYQMLGYEKEALMGMNYRQAMDAEFARRVYAEFNRVYRTGKSVNIFNGELIRKDGSTCYVETLVSPVKDTDGQVTGFKGIARDVSERKKLNAQIRQLQKMEAIGTLAGGIAHDFNNILSSVIGYTELSIDEVPQDTVLHHNLSAVLEAGNRAKALVKQILTISRREEQEFAPVQIVPLLKETLKMMRATTPATIEIRENIANESFIVRTDPTQFHQVIVNLATNAVKAMENESGILAVDVEAVNLDEHMTQKHPEVVSGDYARITVSDTGIGIASHHLDKIFEPYFTTWQKTVDGSGLGLSVVYSIVRKHNGFVTVYSEIGRGTTFHVYMPMAENRRPKAAKPPEETLPRGTEHILVLDDEPQIVNMMQQKLNRLGYTATTATSSKEALDQFRLSPERFDLVLTDMSMPRMTGDTLAHAIKAIRPDMPVILCTGYNEKLDENSRDLPIEALLMKPADQKTLATTIRRVLDGAKA